MVESCECEEFFLRLPDAIWYHLHSKPRAEGQENQDGKRRSGCERRPPKPGRRVPSTPLTQVGAQAALGLGSPAQDRSIRSHLLILTTKLLPSCVLAILNTQGLHPQHPCLRGHPTVPYLAFSLHTPGLVLPARCPSIPITGPLRLIISWCVPKLGGLGVESQRLGSSAHWLQVACPCVLRSRHRTTALRNPHCPSIQLLRPQHPATAPWSSHCLTIHPCRAPSPVPCNPNSRPPLLRSPVVSRSGPHAFEPLFSQPSTTTSL